VTFVPTGTTKGVTKTLHFTVKAAIKKKVTSETDLPRFTYSFTVPASTFAQADDATFNAFAAKVRTDLDAVLRDYDIADRSTLRQLVAAKLSLQEIAGEYPAALETIATLRGLQDKPAAKLTTGLLDRAWIQAAIDAKEVHGPAFAQAFAQRYAEAINALPSAVVGDSIKRAYVTARIMAKGVLLGHVMTELDPAVKKSGGLDNLEAWELIETRTALQFIIRSLRRAAKC